MFHTQPYYIAEIIVGILTIATNSLDLIAVLRSRSLRTFVNYCVVSMAVANIIAGLMVAPLSILSSVGWPHNFYGCLGLNSILGMVVTIAFLNLVLVDFHCYFNIVHNVSHQRYLPGERKRLLLAVPWLLGILIGLVPAMGWHKDPARFKICSYASVIDLRYNVYLHFLGFFLPLLLTMTIFHVHTFQFVSASAKRKSQCRSSSSDERYPEHVKRLAGHLAAIVVVTAVCWMPINVIDCILNWSPSTLISLPLVQVSVLLSHCHAAIVPVLFAHGQTAFLQELKTMICPCKDSAWCQKKRVGFHTYVTHMHCFSREVANVQGMALDGKTYEDASGIKESAPL